MVFIFGISWFPTNLINLVADSVDLGKNHNFIMKQAGMSFAQPQAEAVSLKFVLVFVCIYNFKSPFLNFLTFGVVPSAEVSNYSKI